MIVALHKSKQPKHGGSILGRERLERARVDGFSERYFRRQFMMGTKLFKQIAKSVKLHEHD
jgi:hypothetical protein